MKEIFLLRHGETEWNRLGLGQGSRNDTELNETGIEQSIITGNYLRDYKAKEGPFDLILSSPLKRTKKTAEIIAKKINYQNKIIYLNELVERDKGLISIGISKAELRKNPFYYDYFTYCDKIKDDDNLSENKKKYINSICKKYKYEPNENMKKRINYVIDYIKKTDAKKILIVSHGGTIKTIIYMMSGIKPINNYIYGRNCHISYFMYHNNNFKLLYHPNTLHFGLYGKDYINDRDDYQ